MFRLLSRSQALFIPREPKDLGFMRPLAIYHADCADGFTGAWVAHRAFSGQLDLHAAAHGSAPPEVLGREVYLIDFAYPRDITEELRDRARRLIVLDHHKTAAEALTGLAGIESIFDMERSGAHIAWDYFNPGCEPPQLLLHIEDQDIGRFELPFTRGLNLATFSYPYTIEMWNRLMRTDLATLIHEGSILQRKLTQDLRRLLPALTRRLLIGGYCVPAVNLPVTLASEAARTLSQGEPFAVCYWDTPSGRTFSLRSTPKGIDVAEVAQQYGGGGHARAAGFRLSVEAARAFEIT